MARACRDALEWAAQLWRAPSIRHFVRLQPLPPGMSDLITIAGGAGEGLTQAAECLGEREDRVLEGVRFALREGLFYPGADAYRTLGLDRDAPHATLRTHHRLLQQWLHPDRCSGEDAVFAARVNAAWDQLRTPERRRAYDACLPDLPPPANSANPAALAMVWRHEAFPERNPRVFRWRQRAPLIALLAACMGLGTLALLDQAHEPALYAGIDDTQSVHDPLVALTPPPPARSQSTQPRHGSPERESRRTLMAAASRPIPPAHGVLPPTPSAAVPIVPAVQIRPSAPKSVSTPLPAASTMASTKAFSPGREAVAAPAPEAPRVQETTAAMPAPAGPGPSPGTAAAAPPDPDRVRAAEQVGDRLLRYLGGRSARVPPIWDNLGAQQAAESMRGALTEAPRVALMAPTWRMRGESAALDAGLVYKDGSAGRVRARLVWREERWLVADVSMERDR